MELEVAKRALRVCFKEEVRDMHLDDIDVMWTNDRNEVVATGLFAPETDCVIFRPSYGSTCFTGPAAKQLLPCCLSAVIYRVDFVSKWL